MCVCLSCYFCLGCILCEINYILAAGSTPYQVQAGYTNVKKRLHNMAPRYLSDECQLCRTLIVVSARRSSAALPFDIARPRTRLVDRSFDVASSRTWNKFPSSMLLIRIFSTTVERTFCSIKAAALSNFSF